MNDAFLFYKSWAEIIEKLYADDEDTLKDLYTAIIRHGIFERDDLPAEKAFLTQVYVQIDIALGKRKEKIEAGRKGGLSKSKQKEADGSTSEANASKPKQKQATGSKLKQTQPNVNVNVNDNEHFHINENENANENEHYNASSRSPSGTAPIEGGGPSGVEDEGYIDFEWGDDD